MNLLKAPYPAPCADGPKKNIRSSAAIALFVFVFLVVLRPMDLPTAINLQAVTFIFGFAVITFSICILYLVLIPSYWEKPFRSERWNLLKSMSYTSCLVFTIALCNLLYIDLYNESFAITSSLFLSFVAGTFLIGIIPTAFVLTLDYQKSKLKYMKQGLEIKEDIGQSVVTDEVLVFESNYDEEAVKVSLNHLLFVVADGNYITIHMKGKPRKMIRNSLKYVLEITKDFPYLEKTHRSYIVNLRNVSDLKGNAQGFVLNFPSTEQVARVSRSHTKPVKELLSSL